MSRFIIFIAASLTSIFCLAQVPDTVGIVGFGEFRPPKTIPGVSVWINVPQQRQEFDQCVPTSTSMILFYYGHFYPPREIKVWSRGLEYDSSAPFNDFTVTYFRDLLPGLKLHGINWAWENFSFDQSGFEKGMKIIKQQLDQKRPVLVDTSLFGGHTLVVAGYNNSEETIFVVDPNIASPGLRVIKESDFALICQSHKAKPIVRAAIFSAP